MAPKKTIDELYAVYERIKDMQEEETRAMRARHHQEQNTLREEHREALEPLREQLKDAVFATCPWAPGEDFRMHGTDAKPQRWRVTRIEVMFAHHYAHEGKVSWKLVAKRVRKDGAMYGDSKEFSASTMLLYAEGVEPPDIEPKTPDAVVQEND